MAEKITKNKTKRLPKSTRTFNRRTKQTARKESILVEKKK
jgi:hypothetical protein